MSQQYPSSWKQCATCAFWCGARETDSWGSRVTVASCSVVGKCAIPSGGWKGQNRQASGNACRDYQKWPVLK